MLSGLSTLSRGLSYLAGVIVVISIITFFGILWYVSGSPFSYKIPPGASNEKVATSFILLIFAWGVVLPLASTAIVITAILYIFGGAFRSTPIQPAKYNKINNA